MDHVPLTPEQVSAADGLGDWRCVLRALHARFDAPSFPAAAALVAAVAAAAESARHHPDVDLRYPGRVHVALTTHATGGLTTLDVDLARVISALAAEHGATAAAPAGQQLEIAVDTPDAARIRPFWCAVLGYRDDDGVLVDPARQGAPMWFQDAPAPRPGRGRLHLDVNVAHDVAEERVAAALAAGGRLVSDEHARAWWVLADADGNEVCISTWLDRPRRPAEGMGTSTDAG